MVGRAPLGAWQARTAREWASYLGVPELELHGCLPSTSSRLRALAEPGAAPFTTVVAGEQSAGRGRAGRRWHSPPGAGLWMSVLLEVDGAPEIGVLPLAVGVSAARALEEVGGSRVGLKWPNDILLGRRKLAGILCEVHGEGGRLAIVGIGVNVRRPGEGYPAELAVRAGFLEEAAGEGIEVPRLARAIIQELRAWAHPAPAFLVGALREEWEARDILRGRPVRLDTGTCGVAEGVSGEGWLRVLAANGTVATARAGGVEVLGPQVHVHSRCGPAKPADRTVEEEGS